MKILLLFVVFGGEKERAPLIQGLKKENLLYFSEIPTPVFWSANLYSPHLIDKNYILSPGDSIKIKFFGNFNSLMNVYIPHTGDIVIASNPVFNRERSIDTIPFLGKFHVAGKTIKEIEKEIREKLKEKYPDTDVAIWVSGLGDRIIHIVGDVPFPGYYKVSPLIRITGALLLSGIIGNELKEGKIYLIRNGQKMEIQIEKYLDQGNLEANPYLKNGDIIIFEKK